MYKIRSNLTLVSYSKTCLTDLQLPHTSRVASDTTGVASDTTGVVSDTAVTRRYTGYQTTFYRVVFYTSSLNLCFLPVIHFIPVSILFFFFFLFEWCSKICRANCLKQKNKYSFLLQLFEKQWERFCEFYILCTRSFPVNQPVSEEFIILSADMTIGKKH